MDNVRDPLRLADLTTASAAVAATSSRLAKTAAIADVLRARAPAEVALAVSYLTGELPQRQIGVGWAALRELPEPAATPSLTARDVDAACLGIGTAAGAGSQKRRRALVLDLFARATSAEQDFLRRLLLGELRQGAAVGLMTDAVARATGAPLSDVRRAVLLRGDLAAVATAAAEGGAAALARFALEVGRPVGPMLAQTAASVADAVSAGVPVAVEWKLDGARVQIHRRGPDVWIFTRTLDDVTARLPEVVEAVRSLPVADVVLDGEVIALRPDGRPHPFQVTASRFGTRVDTGQRRRDLPLSSFVFDVLHVDGRNVLDRPLAERLAVLEPLLPETMRVPRLITDDPAAAQTFFDDTVAAGHEGVMIKGLDAPYDAGRRGASWRKIKPVHTLDLVVTAVEWGSGRRRGWLSNLHLAARGPDGELVMLGKTFKGMTDAMLAWQTEHLMSLAVDPTDGYVVTVRPELVVEIALDGVQTSSRYPGGMALRFARVLRYRPDKTAAEADTVETVRALQVDGA